MRHLAQAQQQHLAIDVDVAANVWIWEFQTTAVFVHVAYHHITYDIAIGARASWINKPASLLHTLFLFVSFGNNIAYMSLQEIK